MYSINVDALKGPKLRSGFTIVELLIVVVVIAILAAITIVSYNGITKSAVNSSIQETLSQAHRSLEVYKINSASSLYPASLSDAGLDLVSVGDTAYVYAVSPDKTVYCLASSKASRTYYISSATSKAQAGICTNTTGVPGTGDVAIDGTSTGPATYSIYNGQAPGTNRSVFSDGGGSLKVGNRFYTLDPAGVKVVGLRIYNPASSSAPFLALNVTAYAYMLDWTGSWIGGPATYATTPVETKVYSGTRTAGTWTDILFDNPITLPTITAGSGSNDLITLAVQYSGGDHYVYVTPVGDANYPTQSVVQPGTYLAEENGLGRGANTVTPGVVNTYYGIDILYTEI